MGRSNPSSHSFDHHYIGITQYYLPQHIISLQYHNKIYHLSNNYKRLEKTNILDLM